MEYNEEEINIRKYFLGPNKEKIYAKKEEGHKALAHRIIHEIEKQ